MNSPTLRAPYNLGLNLSAVYEIRIAKPSTTEGAPFNAHKQQEAGMISNKSSFLDIDNSNKDYSNLRRTIGSPEGLSGARSKKQIDQYLRNSTNHASKPGQQTYNQIQSKPFGESSCHVRPRNASNIEYQAKKQTGKTLENGQTNYNKIMQKLQKKQKLINELKKLSEIKPPEKPREKNTSERGSKKEESINDKPVNAIKKQDLSKSTATQNKQKNDSSFNYLKEKILNKIPAFEQKNSKPGNKNPEEESKNRSVYYTPKGTKTDTESKYQTRFTPKTNANNYTNLSNFDLLNEKNPISQSLLNVSSINYTSSFYKEIYSPTLSIKSKESNHNLEVPTSLKEIYSSPSSIKNNSVIVSKQAKTLKDIRQQAETRFIKTATNYFTKKVSIYDFQLGKSLGQGKFGKVYQAIHKQTNSLFALKKIKKSVIKQNYMIDQFLLEVKIQSFCQHQNILTLHGCFDDTEYIYLILEYMEEGTLFQLLKKSKTFTEQKAAIILKQVAEAIKYLHEKGIAHRDIKPENIVLSNGIGKLCDFGWAAICNERRKTYCGTFDYAAPQILEGVQYDMSVDLWCLGVLAYELLVGKAPFYHISRKQTMKKILNVQSTAIEFPTTMSQQAISFIQNLIKKNPLERMNTDNILKHPFLQRDRV